MSNRRDILKAAIAAPFMSAVPSTFWRATAQEKYPNRPVTLVLPYAAGGGTDAIARLFARALEQRLGGNIVVENRPGAGGNIATDGVATAAPDGHTLLIGNQGPMVVNPHLFRNMKNDPATKLDPIAMIADASLVLVTGPKMKVNSLKEFLEEAKSRTGGLNYGSASNASASHLAALLLSHVAGIKATHVAYQGASPALNDLVGGHFDYMITTIPSVTGLIQGGQLKAICVIGDKRVGILPDVPTAIEAGLPGYTASAWYGLMAPKGLPAATRAILEKATLDALKDEALLKRLHEDGANTSSLKGDAMAGYMTEERARWGEVIKAAGIRL